MAAFSATEKLKYFEILLKTSKKNYFGNLLYVNVSGESIAENRHIKTK